MVPGTKTKYKSENGDIELLHQVIHNVENSVKSCEFNVKNCTNN